MDETPLMLFDVSLEMVWAPMVRVLADMLGVTLDDVRIQVERRPLERTIEEIHGDMTERASVSRNH